MAGLCSEPKWAKRHLLGNGISDVDFLLSAYPGNNAWYGHGVLHVGMIHFSLCAPILEGKSKVKMQCPMDACYLVSPGPMWHLTSREGVPPPRSSHRTASRTNQRHRPSGLGPGSVHMTRTLTRTFTHDQSHMESEAPHIQEGTYLPSILVR